MSPIPILACGHEKTKLGLMARLHWGRRGADACMWVGQGGAGHEVGSHHCVAASAKAAGYNNCDLGDLRRGGGRYSPCYQLLPAMPHPIMQAPPTCTQATAAIMQALALVAPGALDRPVLWRKMRGIPLFPHSSVKCVPCKHPTSYIIMPTI